MQDEIAGTTSSINGSLLDFPAPILSKIVGQLTREALINLHQFISVNYASVVWIPAQTPHADYDSQVIHDTERIYICATTQPRQLSTNNKNRHTASTHDRRVSKKTITIQNKHRRVGSTKKQIVTAVQQSSCTHWWTS